MEPNHVQRHGQALAGVLLCLGAALLLYHSLAGGTLLAANAWDSYSLQAENWLAGRNYIAGGEQYTWLELAVYNGRYYQSFPPVPAVLMLPWVLAAGSAARVPANLVAALLALCIAAGAYACFWRRGAQPVTAAYFAVFLTMGSNTFWLSTSGGVWFLAQVCGLSFAVWGLFYALGDTPAQDALASFCFAAAIGCRPFYIVLALLWGGGRLYAVLRRLLPPQRLLPAMLPALGIAAAMMAYNAARFGNALEFGHNYLPEFVRAEQGQFSLHYFWTNLGHLLRPVTLDAALRLQFPVFEGFSPFIANPLLLLWALCGLRALAVRPKPTGAPFVLPGHGGLLAAAAVLVVLGYCLHHTLGGWQFGARYTVEALPYALVWFLGLQPGWRPRAGAGVLCALAVLFNLYGAVFMLQA